MNSYLFDLKFIVSKPGLKMLRHVALICTIYCITDIISTCQSGDSIVRFFGSFYHFLYLNFVNQITKNNLSKNYYQIQSMGFPKQKATNSEYGISKTKGKFLTTTVIICFINSKTRCAYFNSLMPVGRKRLNLLKQIYSQKLVFILSMHDFFYHPA